MTFSVIRITVCHLTLGRSEREQAVWLFNGLYTSLRIIRTIVEEEECLRGLSNGTNDLE